MNNLSQEMRNIKIGCISNNGENEILEKYYISWVFPLLDSTRDITMVENIINHE